jgi:hypothetical protein
MAEVKEDFAGIEIPGRRGAAISPGLFSCGYFSILA